MTHARYSDERRRSRRVPVSGNLRFQYSRQEGGHGELIDADLGGICLRTTAVLETGQHVMLELLADDGSTIAELKGRVVWTRAGASGGTEAGIRVYGYDWDAQQALCALVAEGYARQNVVLYFKLSLPGSAEHRPSAGHEQNDATRRLDAINGLYARGLSGHLAAGL